MKTLMSSQPLLNEKAWLVVRGYTDATAWASSVSLPLTPQLEVGSGRKRWPEKSVPSL